MVGIGRYSKNGRQQGFTLIELIITVAIIAVLASIASPSMQKQMAEMRLKDAVNLAEMTFKQARTDALVYQTDVTITMTVNTPPIASSLLFSQTQNGTEISQTKNFNPQVRVTLLHNMPTAIRFTKTKQALNDLATTTTPVFSSNVSNQTVGYCFSYNNVNVDKYILTIDALTNVTMKKDTAGECL